MASAANQFSIPLTDLLLKFGVRNDPQQTEEEMQLEWAKFLES